ncbi:hypothetical protein BC827DRAFT_1271599 [Russula dissimulans]|nr:hypothetical protein BC827DRAFT_1271599 [Russula dissimulans]
MPAVSRCLLLCFVFCPRHSLRVIPSSKPDQVASTSSHPPGLCSTLTFTLTLDLNIVVTVGLRLVVVIILKPVITLAWASTPPLAGLPSSSKKAKVSPASRTAERFFANRRKFDTSHESSNLYSVIHFSTMPD